MNRVTQQPDGGTSSTARRRCGRRTITKARPWRLTAAAVYELPFGPDKPFLSEGGVYMNIARGSTIGATYEYQPGALLQWNNNLFFSGNLDDIAKKVNPEIAILPDGTFNPTKTWFNIDAGFERDTADQPAGFQKRVFPFTVDGVRGFDVSYFEREHRAHVRTNGREPTCSSAWTCRTC